MSTSGSYTPPPPPARQAHARAVTDSSGNAVLTWPPGLFTGPPVVTLAVQAGDGFRSVRISVNSATQTTVNVQVAGGLTLLGLGVLAVGVAASGVTVHATATEP
ncbi:hypothetical protein HTV80_00095 [Streptomyces sp. Vc74B-19]|uniref:hypothetical protein n=1 Tax=Streptomyces sp. Vc74B-19 TaxID=2741324 RepID=UPI001BFCD286|nr:hypothetical protein [Streptomyces sp. Vc74B-19]MBT3161514.1 hypothetical protein [Streptomyces sp. Vc74B-19]